MMQPQQNNVIHNNGNVANFQNPITSNISQESTRQQQDLSNELIRQAKIVNTSEEQNYKIDRVGQILKSFE